jgi:hypothetical protein
MNRQKKVPSQPLKFLHPPFISFVVSIIVFFLCAAPAHSAQLTLIWDPNPETDLLGYKLYYKTVSSGAPYNGTGADQGPSPIDLPIESLTDPENPECSLTGLDDNEFYFFVATAYNANGESDYSEEFIYNTANALATDFGSSYGLWHFNGTKWIKIDISDPEYLGSYDDNVVIDFGSSGLWAYNNSFWIDISTLNADNSGKTMVAHNGYLVFDFGGEGLWLYDGTALTEITDLNPDWIEVYNDKLVCDLGTSGLWEYDGSSWTEINTSDADNTGDTMLVFAGRLVIDFGSNGLWSYDGTDLTKINDSDAEWFGVYNGKLMCDLGTSGLWEYDGSSWTDINTSNADNSGNTMLVYGSRLVFDFGSNGLWSYDGAEFSEITDLNSEWLSVYEDILVSDFGPSGLWEYDGSLWTEINTTNADNSGNTMVACTIQKIAQLLNLPGMLLLLLGE